MAPTKAPIKAKGSRNLPAKSKPSSGIRNGRLGFHVTKRQAPSRKSVKVPAEAAESGPATPFTLADVVSAKQYEGMEHSHKIGRQS
jgi:hypothetical protein